MAKLWVVTKREYLERVRTKWFVISTIFGPLLMSAMLFGPAVMSMRSMRASNVPRMTILDATGVGLGDRVRRQIAGADSASARVEVRVVPPEGLAEAEAVASKEVVAKGGPQGYLVLGAGAVSGDSARYVGRNASSAADMRRVETAVRQQALALRLESAGLDAERVQALTNKRLAFGTERLSEYGRGGGGLGNLAFSLAVAFLLYMMVFLYGQNVLRGVMEEKQTRVAEVVISSVKPQTLLAGKVLGVGAVGLTQIVVWMASTMYLGSLVGPFLSGLARSATQVEGARSTTMVLGAMPSVSLGMMGLLIVFFLLGYVLYASLFAAVGSTVNSEQEAQQALQPVLILLIGISLLIQPVIFNPTGGLARWASLIPFSAPVIMPLRMSLVAVPPMDVAISVLGVFAACFVAVWVAARIYRVGLLMYGKRPTYGEIARWVRRAA